MKISKKIIAAILFSAITLSVVVSCELEEDGEDSNTEESSHNSGADCMLCHKKGGHGEGVFTVAGTVYDSLQTSLVTGATVYLYSDAERTKLITSAVSDQSGNFYTSASVNFSNPVYTSVKAANGNIKKMNGKIAKGNCNACHGATMNYIWVK